VRWLRDLASAVAFMTTTAIAHELRSDELAATDNYEHHVLPSFPIADRIFRPGGPVLDQE
jgi:hypothetical protein